MSVSGRDFFRKAILRKSLNRYYSLNIHNSELNDKFSLLARELNKKNVIDTSYEFLKNTYVMHNESIPHKSKTKILLSCFMIDKHPHVLLSDETDIEKKVEWTLTDYVSLANAKKYTSEMQNSINVLKDKVNELKLINEFNENST